MCNNACHSVKFSSFLDRKYTQKTFQRKKNQTIFLREKNYVIINCYHCAAFFVRFLKKIKEKMPTVHTKARFVGIKKTCHQMLKAASSAWINMSKIFVQIEQKSITLFLFSKRRYASQVIFCIVFIRGKSRLKNQKWSKTITVFKCLFRNFATYLFFTTQLSFFLSQCFTIKTNNFCN